MKSKGLFLLALGVFAIGLCADVFGLAARKPSVSMLVVPAHYTIIQVGNDIISQRPGVMVSYSDTEERELHVWNGALWIPVGVSDLAAANFVRNKPARVVFVGKTDAVGDLVDSVPWCEDVAIVEDLQTTALLNKLGRIFNFSEAEWNWFAKRYGCELNIRNRDRIGRSWYDQSRDEFLAREAALNAEKNIEMPEAMIEDQSMEEVEPIEQELPEADIDDGAPMSADIQIEPKNDEGADGVEISEEDSAEEVPELIEDPDDTEEQ